MAERITRLIPDRQRGYFLFTNDDGPGSGRDSEIASFKYTCKRLFSLITATGTWNFVKDAVERQKKRGRRGNLTTTTTTTTTTTAHALLA
jgi:hypothetical protein